MFQTEPFPWRTHLPFSHPAAFLLGVTFAEFSLWALMKLFSTYRLAYGTRRQNQNILLCSRMKGEEIAWNMKQARGLKRFPKGNLFCNANFGVEAFNSESLL